MSFPSSVWLEKSTIWPGKDAASDAYSCASGCVSSTSVTFGAPAAVTRSEEHTSELQSLMRISYAVFCLKKKKKQTPNKKTQNNVQHINIVIHTSQKH